MKNAFNRNNSNSMEKMFEKENINLKPDKNQLNNF